MGSSLRDLLFGSSLKGSGIVRRTTNDGGSLLGIPDGKERADWRGGQIGEAIEV